MDILFFSINLIGCLIYFLYSFKSHTKVKHNDDYYINEDNTIKNIDKRLAKLEKQLENQKS